MKEGIAILAGDKVISATEKATEGGLVLSIQSEPIYFNISIPHQIQLTCLNNFKFSQLLWNFFIKGHDHLNSGLDPRS